MKKLKKLIYNSFLVLTLPINSLVCFSCSSGENDPITPIDENPTIVGSSSKIQVVENNLDHSCSVCFQNFSYENISFPSLLRVENNFHQGRATFDSTIIDWDGQNKTFSVQVYCNNVCADTLTGSFTFFYNNKIVPATDVDNYQITFIERKSIVAPEIKSDENVIDNDGYSHFIFRSFSFYNFSDISKLDVTSSFEADGSEITTSLDLHTETSTFDILIDVSNAKPITIYGQFTFIYDGEKLTQDVPTDIFSITSYDHPFIYAPLPENKDLFSFEDQGSITFEGFRAIGISSPQDIIVTSSFTSITEYGDISVSIVNWSPLSKTFSVKLDIVSPKIASNIKGNFKFEYDGEIILETEEIFGLSINIYIPYSLLSITQDDQGFVLSGLANKTEPVPQTYNVLQIPPWVYSIADNAFDQTFKKNPEHPELEVNPHVCYLSFLENSILRTIGMAAFRFDNAFKGKVVFPRSLELIKSQAFYCAFDPVEKCELSFIPGSPKLVLDDSSLFGMYINNGLTLPTNLITLKRECIGQTIISGPLVIPSSIRTVEFGAFSSMMEITSIDLSSYTSVPEWAINAKPEDYILGGITPPQSLLNPVVYLNHNLSDSQLNLFGSYLKTNCSLPNRWIIKRKDA